MRNEFSFHIGVSKVKEEVEEVYCRHWKWKGMKKGQNFQALEV